MGDELPTVWPAEPHTLAKHAILRSYLQAWSAIMSRQAAKTPNHKQHILFIDAFAGPGVYEGGEDGSPVLAIKTALTHTHSFPVPIHCIFIEKDPGRFSSLTQVLSQYEDQIEASANISIDPPHLGDCNTVLEQLLQDYDLSRRAFGPALVFLDQFGYSEVPMSLIKRIMRHEQCEVFSYLNYKHLSWLLTDPQKDEARTEAFASDEWKGARSLSGAERSKFLLQLYKKNLRAKAAVKYVWDFAMADASNQLIYWLFFCTNNLRGLEEMKKAMRRVDDTGAFRFSDQKDPWQPRLFKEFDEEWLGNHLATTFAGKVVTIRQVKEYVLTSTPLHNYARVLGSLERTGDLEPLRPPGSNQKTAYTKDLALRIRFAGGGSRAT